MKILVTGFQPFLGEKLNPSALLAQSLAKQNENIEALILPVEFAKSFLVLEESLRLNSVDKLVMLGQAAGRNKICLEKIALNWVQSEHPDEAGFKPVTGKIIPEAPLALMTTFPIDDLYQNLKATQNPVEISFSAGTYVCNDLYFRVLSKRPTLSAIFIHVPLMSEQDISGARPTMDFRQMEQTLQSFLNLAQSQNS